jgi:hypothetical protein
LEEEHERLNLILKTFLYVWYFKPFICFT